VTDDERLVQKRVIRQVEYYFGDHNLPKDRFMLNKMDNNNGWMPLDDLMSFPRLQMITTDPDLVMTSLEASPTGLMVVDRAKRRVRRDPHIPLPIVDMPYKLALQVSERDSTEDSCSIVHFNRSVPSSWATSAAAG